MSQNRSQNKTLSQNLYLLSTSVQWTCQPFTWYTIIHSEPICADVILFVHIFVLQTLRHPQTFKVLLAQPLLALQCQRLAASQCHPRLVSVWCVESQHSVSNDPCLFACFFTLFVHLLQAADRLLDSDFISGEDGGSITRDHNNVVVISVFSALLYYILYV